MSTIPPLEDHDIKYSRDDAQYEYIEQRHMIEYPSEKAGWEQIVCQAAPAGQPCFYVWRRPRKQNGVSASDSHGHVDSEDGKMKKETVKSPRFIVECRSGIIAIYDTHHHEYHETQGCHGDYPWTLCAWHGRYVTPPSKECTNGCGHWIVDQIWMDKANATCELLNQLFEDAQEYMSLSHQTEVTP